jgi:hypothetical protein
MSNSASPTVYARSKNPLLHPNLLFHMSSLGRQQAKYLATVNARSMETVEERAKQLRRDKGEEKCLKQESLAGYADQGLIQGCQNTLKPYLV